jgi:DNA-binding MarR family transcriptional regulator
MDTRTARRKRGRRTRPAEAQDFDLDNFVPNVVSTLTRYLHGAMTRSLVPLGMNIPEWRVTFCLMRNDSSTLNEIVEMTGLKQSSLSRTLARMERKGLISRSRRETDSRFMDARITDHGRKMGRRATLAVQSACEEELAVLDAGEREVFIATMKRLIANIDPPDRPTIFQY